MLRYRHGRPCLLACRSSRSVRVHSKPSQPLTLFDQHHSTYCTSLYRASSTSSLLTWDSFQASHGTKLESLPEVIAMNKLDEFLRQKVQEEEKRQQAPSSLSSSSLFSPSVQSLTPPRTTKQYKHMMDANQIKLCLDSSMMTFLLHVYSRQASLVGQGFYTIGPCGEEMLSSVALSLHPYDSLALHYRHLAISISRQLHDKSNNKGRDQVFNDEDVKDVLLARARGYAVSKHDPVTGGVHCALGGGPNDYIVTSTLASQCPPAVGRALAYSLNDSNVAGEPRNQRPRPISMCTIGDGSVHNGHFWSAWTLAKHAKHMNIECPLVMGISDNGLSISYQTKGFVHELFRKSDNKSNEIPIFRVDGRDMMDVYYKTIEATTYARKYSSPTLLLYTNMVRRFGHAATDRQLAYLNQDTIDSMADTDVLQSAMTQSIEVYNSNGENGGYAMLRDRYHQLREWTREAFEVAMNEPKVTLDDMMERVSAQLVSLPSTLSTSVTSSDSRSDSEHVTTINTSTHSYMMNRDNTSTSAGGEQSNNTDTVDHGILTGEKPQVLRKQMTRVLDEIMTDDPSVVYLGEDVIHGGYYLVTEGLAAKFNTDIRRYRIFDFPPDETSLLGSGLGFRQVGNVVPIVELPYAKYLDCGVDMFYEIAVLNWLSNRNVKLRISDNGDEVQPHGMVIRLQGFDRGIFGGNFHTHNMLSHIPPGVDVVCYSNGYDYVQGMRHATYQAKQAGRIVVCVDCTNLLNLRHLHDVGDRQWECQYPNTGTYLGFDDIRRYRCVMADTDQDVVAAQSASFVPLAIVSYGNGVVTALQARKSLVEQGIVECESNIDVIDCPYLSGVPKGLEEILPEYHDGGIVFADICKEGPGSNVFSSMIMQLQDKLLLPSSSDRWTFVGAPRTYNPLGSTVTFLTKERIEDAVKGLLRNR